MRGARAFALCELLAQKRGSSAVALLVEAGSYRLYVLTLLLVVYLLNQCDRYAIAVTSRELERDIGFGDGEGGGYEYQVLAGPAFTFVFSFAALPLSLTASRHDAARTAVGTCMTPDRGTSRTAGTVATCSRRAWWPGAS